MGSEAPILATLLRVSVMGLSSNFMLVYLEVNPIVINRAFFQAGVDGIVVSIFYPFRVSVAPKCLPLWSHGRWQIELALFLTN